MDRQLADVFASFCAFGSGAHPRPELDNAKFAKLCRDTGLLDRRFTPTEADLAFSKVKPRGARVIDFHCFKQALLPEIAQRKGVAVSEVMSRICGGRGPSSSGTVAESVQLHDDPTMYTGVYRHGGPSCTDLGTADLSQITNRQEADVRGVASPPHRSHSGSRIRGTSFRGGSSVDRGSERASSVPRMSRSPQPDLIMQRMGAAEVASSLTLLESLRDRGVPLLDGAIHLMAAALSSDGRVSPHRLRDGSDWRSQSSQSMSRSGMRGRAPSARSRPSPRGLRSPGEAADTRTWCTAENMRMLEELFNSFCAFGAGQRGSAEMDCAKFAKFCRDTGIIGRRFTPTDADLVFSKVKPKGGRTLDFNVFVSQAIPEVAARRGGNVQDLLAMMRGGPLSTGTVAESVALHDDLGTYTGVYARGGPTNVDHPADLSGITNRSPADVRGIPRLG
eukprot:TRINITY_DN20943_c0_g1_i1.p1 TRINITY_DN20943_c0_g1~~TRINITY_DN20943_c0_g1_i1.p1  ORF type:complete len:477 (+),score=107.35 TRINITY_DN20943_c0_g1_i1:90-1433(+)